MKKLFDRWKLYDTVAAFFSFMGLVLAIVYYEVDASTVTNQKRLRADIIATDTLRYNNWWVPYFRFSIMVVSLIAIIFIVLR